MFTILYYMSLSLYRIDRLVQLKAFFIICATVNAIYCCKLATIPSLVDGKLTKDSGMGRCNGLEYV